MSAQAAASIRATSGQHKSVSILGVTGSIGTSTLDVMSQHEQTFQVAAITAHRNVEKLALIALKTHPALCVIGDESCYNDLKDKLSGSGIRVAAGADALCEAASLKADLVVAAMVGAAGLRPLLSAIRQGTTIALANKESLVCAGTIMQEACRTHHSTLLPVDSEHSAIFQVFDFARPERVDHITLTASGGPFLNHTPQQMETITPQSAVRHPNWEMGAKISVDSATMMNKALEMIEAFHLFPITPAQIEVLIHPESVVHSLVHYVDGSVLAQLGTPDMRTPISCALSWPDRLPLKAPRLDLAAIGKLHFQTPDEQQFPALRLARHVLHEGAAAAITLNAANEVAVAAFLDNKIPFNAILPLIENALEQMTAQSTIVTLEDVLACDATSRNHTQQRISS